MPIEEWTTCHLLGRFTHGSYLLLSITLVDRPSLSNPPSKIVAHEPCIAVHHQWVASCPPIASVPGRFTQHGYLLPISGWHRAHPLCSEKDPSCSSHANPLLTTMRWFTIMVTSSHAFLEGSPNAAASSQSVVGIAPTHCARKTSKWFVSC